MPRLRIGDPADVERIGPCEVHMADVSPRAWRHGGDGAEGRSIHQAVTNRGEAGSRPAFRPALDGHAIRLIRPARQLLECSDRRDGQDMAVIGANDLPPTLMHHRVMPVAEKGEVGQIGRSAMDPVHEMVS